MRIRLTTYIVMVVIGGAIMALATRYGYSLEDARLKREEERANFVRNPRFVNGHEHWGTGYLEDLVRNGNHKEDVDRLPYVVSEPPPCRIVPPTPPRCDTKVEATKSSGRHDAQVARPGGFGSFRFHFQPPTGPHRFGSLSQRIYGLTKNRPYVLTFYAKAAVWTTPGALFATTDLRWENKLTVPPTEDWKLNTLPFNSKEFDYADIRFVIEAPGTVWITDVDVREAKLTPDVHRWF